MIIVLLSGGSGKRLWPLSNDSQSKQFLKLLKDDNELYESMVQRVLRQIKKSHPKSKIYISSNQNQLDILNRQLYDIEIIAEPLSADTYPAIILSAVYLPNWSYAIKNHPFLCLRFVFIYFLFSDIISYININFANRLFPV